MTGVGGLTSGALRYATRATHTARNVAEFVRFGGLSTDEENSPYVVEADRPNYRLRHYFADEVPFHATPIVLVPPLMLTTEVWDVSAATSAVRSLHAAGLDPWVVDFGSPDREPGGLERTLTDHVLGVSDAVDRVAAATGVPVILAGYSQGGMFAYQAAAYRRGKDIDSMVTFGAPVDTTAPQAIPVSPETVARFAGELVDSGLFRRLWIPSWFSRVGFKLLDPAKTVQGRVRYLLQLTDRDALLPRERQRQFLDNDGWTAWSGPAVAELLEQFVTHNRMIEGGFVIDDRLVTLADIELPILTFVGASDTIGHPDSVRGIRRAAPRATVYETTLPAGHFGLVVGSMANTRTWPTVAAWADWRDERAPLPEDIQLADTVDPGAPPEYNPAVVAIAHGMELGIGVGRVVLTTAFRAARLAQGLARDAPAQLPKLARLDRLDPSTRISLGLLLDEQARREPQDVAFLFGDRAYRQREVKNRVDAVVRGLISIGVRQGDVVGVLMGTRPSSFTMIAALSRLGASAAMLRPDGDPADFSREIALAGARRIVSDPEHLPLATRTEGVEWAVLGGGGEARDLGLGVLDMERIEPGDVEVPDWYTPNPQRASDVAFVVFSGEGAGTRALRITNRRWALSALGTASAAALRPGDTVYSVTPIYHSSTLLMSIGGAIAGGARFALASADDPVTFWDEVRRYGATHVSYTWTSLRGVVNAPPTPAERYHPIRMFMGSGMPRNLWRRVLDRFPGTTVLEFYASAEGEAILANLRSSRPGSMGRPIPGTAEVRVARFDLESRRLALGPDGLAREADVDEVGLLLSRVGPGESRDGAVGSVMRGVFERGDVWRSTGDLFLRDESGELWLAGPVRELIATTEGTAIPSGARYALGTIPAVDLVVSYGVPEGAADVMVAALTLRPGYDAELTSADLDKALGKLPAVQRPCYVQVVAELPTTTWGRPVWRDLQQAGVPVPSAATKVWVHDATSGHYEPLS